MLEKTLKKPWFLAYFGPSKRFKIDAKLHPIFNVVFESILAGFSVPLGLDFGGLGPILWGKNFDFLWISFLNRFLLDFGLLWGAFWGAWTSLLGPKTAYFPGLRPGAGFSFNLWSVKGCRGWRRIPLMAHSIFTRTFWGFWPKRVQTLQFTGFRAPLAQHVAIHKLWGTPGGLA